MKNLNMMRSSHAMVGVEGSLKNRIILKYLTATAVLMIGVFVMVYILVHQAVYSHLDGELEGEAMEFAESVRVGDGTLVVEDLKEWMEREHITVDFTPQFVQVVSVSGMPEIVKKSFNLFSDTLTYNSAFSRSVFYSSYVGADPVRQVQVPLFSDGSLEGHVIVATPLREAVLVLHDLRFVLLVSFPLVLLVLFIITRVVVAKSIQPVEKIIETAESITRENLDERILLPEKRDELYRLASTVNSLLDRLGDAYNREKQFTADASHELKTPLASVMGTLEVLVRRPRDRQHYEERIGQCIRELKRMADLVDRLMLLARIDSDTQHPGLRPLCPAVLVPGILERFEHQIREKSLHVQLDLDQNAMCIADEGMLDIMFENLVGNAVKYSVSNRELGIGIIRVHDEVSCSFRSFGALIPAGSSNKVFDRFYRVDSSRNSNIPGTGLGLSVVKKLADIQGIRLHLETAPPDKTVVELRIPAI